MGRKTLKSLAIISSLIYEKEIAYRDPVLYSYNLGGKDGIPYPINLKEYDNVVKSLSETIKHSELQESDSNLALRRLSSDMLKQYTLSKHTTA